jgi:copper transport protein
MLIFRRIGLWILLLALYGVVQPVAAHGYLVRAIPPDRAVLDRPPTRVQYWFSEALEPRFSSIRVSDSSGSVIAEGGLDETNRALLSVRLPADLPDGAYTVDLRLAFASDGHVIVERRYFFLGVSAGAAGENTNAAANPFEVLWRTLLLSGLLLLFGAPTLYMGVLLPAWGNRTYPIGALPPRVMRRLNTTLIIGLSLAGTGHVLALIQQTAVFFDSLPTPDLINIVRTGTRFGDVWNVRTLALLLMGGLFYSSLYVRSRQPGFVRRFWAAMAWAAALTLGTMSASSHAAGSQLLAWVTISIDWLHTLATGWWAGGVAALALVVPVALAPYSVDVGQQALLSVLRQFSRLALLAVAIVISTGVYSALNWIYTPADMGATDYGRSLTLKVLLVGLLLGVGGLHYLAAHPTQYRRWLNNRVQQIISRTLPLETLLAGIVLVAVGVLSATPVPTPPFTAQQLPPPQAQAAVGDLTAALTISPGGPGVNTYDLLLTRGTQPVEDAAVRVQFVQPSRDVRSPWTAAEYVENGLYALAGAQLDRPGSWWALVDINDQRAAFPVDIRAEAAVIQLRQPELIHWIALLMVLATIGYAAYPLVRRVIGLLDLSPASLTIAVIAILATIAIVAATAWLSENSRLQYEASLNPPPRVINTVLPDSASLERGAALYAEHCIVWQSASSFRTIRDDLATIRDEDLYQATRDGWEGLPPCTGDLTDAERWDVVNYFRTLER